MHAAPHELPIEVHAPYVAEMVRQAVLDKLGNAALTDGYVSRTTIDPGAAEGREDGRAQEGLMAYDQRHGYRGPEAHVQLADEAQRATSTARLAQRQRGRAGARPGPAQ